MSSAISYVDRGMVDNRWELDEYVSKEPFFSNLLSLRFGYSLRFWHFGGAAQHGNMDTRLDEVPTINHS